MVLAVCKAINIAFNALCVNKRELKSSLSSASLVFYVSLLHQYNHLLKLSGTPYQIWFQLHSAEYYIPRDVIYGHYVSTLPKHRAQIGHNSAIVLSISLFDSQAANGSRISIRNKNISRENLSFLFKHAVSD